MRCAGDPIPLAQLRQGLLRLEKSPYGLGYLLAVGPHGIMARVLNPQQRQVGYVGVEAVEEALRRCSL